MLSVSAVTLQGESATLDAPLEASLSAALPRGVALTDTCLGQLLRIDASRSVWRCVPGSTVSVQGSGTAVSVSLDTFGTYALVFSSSAAAEHPNIHDVTSPPPTPVAVATAAAPGCSQANSSMTNTTADAIESGFSGLVAAFSLSMLTLAAFIGCVGLCCAGSPIQLQREEGEDDHTSSKIHPLYPGMPGYSGE